MSTATPPSRRVLLATRSRTRDDRNHEGVPRRRARRASAPRPPDQFANRRAAALCITNRSAGVHPRLIKCCHCSIHVGSNGEIFRSASFFLSANRLTIGPTVGREGKRRPINQRRKGSRKTMAKLRRKKGETAQLHCLARSATGAIHFQARRSVRNVSLRECATRALS